MGRFRAPALTRRGALAARAPRRLRNSASPLARRGLRQSSPTAPRRAARLGASL